VKVLLMGHPNVGKSVIFNRLTGADVISSNYPGTTVDYKKGLMRHKGTDIEVIDVPGTFSLEPRDKAEGVALTMLKDNPQARIICVIDASKLERGLYLALDLIEQGHPLVLALNMWDIAHDKNINVDAEKLSSLLGVPVIPTVAVSAEGLSLLMDTLLDAGTPGIAEVGKRLRLAGLMTSQACEGCRGCLLGKACGEIPEHLTSDERWAMVEQIAQRTVTVGHYRHTLKDAIGDYTVKPLTGTPFAIAVLYAFWSIFSTFSGLITDGFMVKAFDLYWLPWLQEWFPGGPGTWIYGVMVDLGHVKDGVWTASTTCLESFGVLTSGLYLEIGVVLPAVFIFYIMLALLEDVGYLPRLAVLMDTFLHKIGLHGYAVVPTILSLGCNVPGVEATRILETKKQRFVMMTILAIFIPCGAQIAIMHDVIPRYTGFVMAYLFLGYFVFGFLLNRVIPGTTPDIIMDVPVYQRPIMRDVRRKVAMRTKSFLKDAIPYVTLGILIVNILYSQGAIDALAKASAPVFEGWFGVPRQTAGPLLAAFLRKDLAIAQLSAIPMTEYQLITAIVLVSIYFPCIGTFFMMLKEGGKAFFGSLIVLICVAFTWVGLLRLVWNIMGVQ